MKKIWTAIISILICANSFALSITYYVSNTGNDGNVGTSSGAPLLTIAKVNTLALNAGDHVLFNGGDVFRGTLNITRSGSPGLPITYGSYGTGNAVITGLTTVTLWTNLGGNIWESTNPVSTLSTLNMVVIGGVNTGMGRYPNSGYLPYQTFTSNTSITSSSLSGSPNWTGAEIVIRSTPWLLQRKVISAQSGGTVVYPGFETPRANYGFFIQNDVRTLDAQNEWYYNSSKKIDIYSTASPTNVQVASVDELVLNTANYITYDHIDFKGSNGNLFETRNSQYVIIRNCSLLNAGRTAIMSNNAVSVNGILTIDGNSFNDNNESAIKILPFTDNFLVQNNSINNTGMIAGMGNPTDDQNTADAINVSGVGTIIQNNTISNTGHIGIAIRRTGNITARNNFIKNFGQVRYDVGAIYSWNADSTSSASRFIDGNVIINNQPTIEGISTGDPIIAGIYLDGQSKNTSITSNTISGCISEGIHILGSGSVTVRNNTVYNNGNLVSYALPNGSALGLLHFTGSGQTVNNLTVKNNIFFARNANQFCLFYRNDAGTFNYGASDSNYYARPINDVLANNLSTRMGSSVSSNTDRSLSQWQAFSGIDVHTKKSPVNITSTNQLFFAYDSVNSPITVTLPAGGWVDVANTSYSGSTVLQPYTSIVLISTGIANVAPTANAGSDQTITLPTSSLTLSGSGADADGTVTAYQWVQISGPNTATFGSATSATTTASGLVQGTYIFQLTATDNQGATGSDVTQVTVNAAVNVAPTSSAGADQSISSSSATLSGSGTDSDGSVASYSWTKISGPGTQTITTPSSQNPLIAGLENGVYVFRLRVTDNLGASTTDDVQITVSGLVPTLNFIITHGKIIFK